MNTSNRHLCSLNPHIPNLWTRGRHRIKWCICTCALISNRIFLHAQPPPSPLLFLGFLCWWLFDSKEDNLQAFTSSPPGGLWFIYSFNCQGDAGNERFSTQLHSENYISIHWKQLGSLISWQWFPSALAGANVSCIIGAEMLQDVEINSLNQLWACVPKYIPPHPTPPFYP